jgi:hypothetical protein
MGILIEGIGTLVFGIIIFYGMYYYFNKDQLIDKRDRKRKG